MKASYLCLGRRDGNGMEPDRAGSRIRDDCRTVRHDRHHVPAGPAGPIDTIVRRWCLVMDHWKALLPLPIQHVDYEETVADLKSVARRLIAACGLDWEPECLAFHQTQRPVRTASLTQVRQPVYQRSVARWRNFEPALSELFAALTVASAPGPPPGESLAQETDAAHSTGGTSPRQAGSV